MCVCVCVCVCGGVGGQMDGCVWGGKEKGMRGSVWGVEWEHVSYLHLVPGDN